MSGDFLTSCNQHAQTQIYTNLTRAVISYYEHRKLTMPNAEDALLFLVSETGELADALVARKPGWVRNNPDKERSVADEIGDVMMMLTVTAMQLGLDPIDCMVNKWMKKGWTP